jgi:hypothetical protein
LEVAQRASITWIGLLAAIEFTDILTTAIGHAKGAVEAMPVSAAVIANGGIAMFVMVKLGLVVAVASAILLALRWMVRGTPGATTLFNFTLWSVRVATVALALVSLHNAVLLTSLQA